jgi:hypothetical protein
VKNTLITAISISAVLLFVSPVLLMADSISAGATVTSDGGSCSNTGTTNAACQASFTAVPYSGGASASATGSLATGSMGAQANYLMGNGFSGGNSQGNIELNYDFTVSNAPTSGTLVFFLSASGTGFVTLQNCPGAPCNSSSAAVFTIEPYESFVGGPSGTQLGLGNGVTLFEVATKYGPTAPTPELVLALEAEVICSSVGGGDSTTCNASSDFIDTVAITGAQVYDSSGNLVNGATLVSDTGFNPNAIPSTVPEPGSVLLFGPGLAGLVRLMRRKIGPSA